MTPPLLRGQGNRSKQTLLTGPVADQAALHGIPARIRDLNLPLISVTSPGKRRD